MIEKIIAAHSNQKTVKPGDIVDVLIDTRAARDFGGANVVKNLVDNGLTVQDPSKTIFTFDCNPGGSDQKYAQNQHYCRQYARENNIRIYDVDSGIGTHVAIANSTPKVPYSETEILFASKCTAHVSTPLNRLAIITRYLLLSLLHP